MKLELGSGGNPREGFTSVDRLPPADILLDLDECMLPLADDSVSEAYASHLLEHVRWPGRVLQELVRVCVLGARVEIRVPHWLSDMAMCGGHHHTISPTQVRHWTKDFIGEWWKGCKKRLSEPVSIEYTPTSEFAELKELYPAWTEQQVLRFAPGASHEIRFVFEVIANTCPPSAS